MKLISPSHIISSIHFKSIRKPGTFLKVECQPRVKDSGIQGGKRDLESFAVDINFQKL